MRKLSPSGDYVWGNNQLDFYIDTPEAIGQLVETSLLLWLGEWYLDVTLGTPFMQGILGKYSQSNADQIIQARVLNVQGVVAIENYESVLDPDTRGLSVTFDLDTIYGPTAVQVQNYIRY